MAPRRSARAKASAVSAKSEGIKSNKTNNATTNGKKTTSIRKKPIKTKAGKTTKSRAAAHPTSDKAERSEDNSELSYWLMKAEPESRMEKGIDVKFSIDDLAAKTEPEPWDGVRNFVARNNMRSMKKGDLAFFYHSNCKIPGIAGTMFIAGEHTADETAQNPSHPYYDPKENPENPKWSLVHVEFRQKFPKLVSLKELQKHKGPGQKLENLQVLKLSRLSVSKVSKDEWEFINELADTVAQDDGV